MVTVSISLAVGIKVNDIMKHPYNPGGDCTGLVT